MPQWPPLPQNWQLLISYRELIYRVCHGTLVESLAPVASFVQLLEESAGSGLGVPEVWVRSTSQGWGKGSAGKMHKPENMASIPRTHVKKLEVVVHPCHPIARDGDKWVPGA